MRKIALYAKAMGTHQHIREQRPADAIPTHWTERHLPDAWLPYARLMRLERPVGWQLLLIPGLWSVTLAQIAEGGGWPDWWLLGLLFIGSVVMRGAGCVYNDIVDRDIDAKVERTRNRPLPSGQVSLQQAVAFMLALLAVGLAVLLQLKRPAQVVAVASLALVAIYPFMKRVTFWPQLFLGLTFNWAALVGWVAVRGRLEWPALLLYTAGVFWTLAYDTIYAHQDREDDLIAGVKSTALRLGAATHRWLVGFFATTVLFLALAGWSAAAGPFWYAGVLAAAVHAAWQVRTLDIDDARCCLKLFRANRDFGLLVFAGALIDSVARGMGLY